MAGIYVHIPFCKKACTYCDFHFSTSLKNVDLLTEAICKEISLKKDRISAPLQSIYFGGGTPSILSERQLAIIFETIYANFEVPHDAEITLEANPDDLNEEKLIALRNLTVNRLSIGVQSFFNEDLLWMNRAHKASEAETCIKNAQDIGFDNLTIDLIFGYPGLPDKRLLANLEKAIAFNIPHISAYALTVEEKTALAHQIAKGKASPLDDEHAAAQFLSLSDTLQNEGYEHYEISNYATPGKYAVHNTNYWRNVDYLGIGPSAHGFNGHTRYFNIANNARYIADLSQNILPETEEKLSFADCFNEYIMTSLRTMWGIDLKLVQERFGTIHADELIKASAPFVKEGKVISQGGKLLLTQEGKLFADGIAATLFIDTSD